MQVRDRACLAGETHNFGVLLSCTLSKTGGSSAFAFGGNTSAICTSSSMVGARRGGCLYNLPCGALIFGDSEKEKRRDTDILGLVLRPCDKDNAICFDFGGLGVVRPELRIGSSTISSSASTSLSFFTVIRFFTVARFFGKTSSSAFSKATKGA